MHGAIPPVSHTFSLRGATVALHYLSDSKLVHGLNSLNIHHMGNVTVKRVKFYVTFCADFVRNNTNGFDVSFKQHRI
jgi:hypothetical protein